MRVVLDTNVIISGLNFPGPERTVLNWAHSGRYSLFLSPHILRETAEVLQRKFGWDNDHTVRALRLLARTATVIEPTQTISRIPDHFADNLVLATALEARADFLVTGDQKHLLPLGDFEGIRILRARDYQRLLEAN